MKFKVVFLLFCYMLHLTFGESDSSEDSDPSEDLPDHTVEVKEQIVKSGPQKGEKKLW